MTLYKPKVVGPTEAPDLFVAHFRRRCAGLSSKEASKITRAKWLLTECVDDGVVLRVSLEARGIGKRVYEAPLVKPASAEALAVWWRAAADSVFNMVTSAAGER